ncbi:MAG: GNAT family N-acetyltransferase [Cocleimonas sp.]|nr:GNAT family N-acetyltransferase [Cocleimonas sp.]
MRSLIVEFDKEYGPDIIHIRTAVFIDEQGIDSKLDFDGLDEVATHVLVIADDVSTGTGRILKDGHIGRIAVLKYARKEGVGAMVMDALITVAKERGYKRVYLGSQLPAKSFYEKLGFKTCGEAFMDAGLQHVEMEMILS